MMWKGAHHDVQAGDVVHEEPVDKRAQGDGSSFLHQLKRQGINRRHWRRKVAARKGSCSGDCYTLGAPPVSHSPSQPLSMSMCTNKPGRGHREDYVRVYRHVYILRLSLHC